MLKNFRITTIIILFAVAINALIAGYLFISDPTGAKLHIPVNILQHSPFKNFLFPGIVLFVVIGVFNIIAAIFTIFQWKNFSTLIVWQGLFLIGWIVIQILFLRDFSWLHIVLGCAGLFLFTLGNRLNV